MCHLPGTKKTKQKTRRTERLPTQPPTTHFSDQTRQPHPPPPNFTTTLKPSTLSLNPATESPTSKGAEEGPRGSRAHSCQIRRMLLLIILHPPCFLPKPTASDRSFSFPTSIMCAPVTNRIHPVVTKQNFRQ